MKQGATKAAEQPLQWGPLLSSIDRLLHANNAATQLVEPEQKSERISHRGNNAQNGCKLSGHVKLLQG
jgi:hypothetical protein